MSISDTVQSLNPGNLVTLIEIDFTNCIGIDTSLTSSNKLYRISSHRNGTSDIVYAGNTYSYVGFQVSSIASELGGQPPKPILTLDHAGMFTAPNSDGSSDYLNLRAAFTSLGSFFDWRGATVKVTKVMNVTTTPEIVEEQNYIVNQMLRENKSTLEIELTVSLGIDKVGSESVQSLSVNRCALRYRKWDSATNSFTYIDEAAGGCPYGNPTSTSNWSAVPDFGNKYFNASDVAVANSQDSCSYSVKGCQLRFDPNQTGLVIPIVALYSPNQVGKNI